MTAASVSRFLHIAVFAVIAGIELPAMYALRLARAPDSNEVTRTLAIRVKRYADALSAIMLVLLLPPGNPQPLDSGTKLLLLCADGPLSRNRWETCLGGI